MYEKFVVYPYEWNCNDLTGNIHMWCMDTNNESVCIRVENFTPYIFFELPEDIAWNASNLQQLKMKFEETKNAPLRFVPLQKKKLYYANVKKVGDTYEYTKFHFVFLAFASEKARKNFVYTYEKGGVSVCGRTWLPRIHESVADPILQLATCRGIPQCGWVVGEGRKVIANGDSICKTEYHAQWNDLSPCNDESIKKTIPSPKILSFDIEVNSTNVNTMPKADRPGDKIFQISFVMKRHGSSEVNKALLTLGHPDQKIVGEDVKIWNFNNEGDLLIGFAELITKVYDPQVIIGYNIFGFDFKYMIARARLIGVYGAFSKFGYMAGVEGKERQIKWSSSAMKNNLYIFVEAPGRLMLDMLCVARKDIKSSKYNLATISTMMLGETKDPLTHRGIFECYRRFAKSPDSHYARKSMGIVGKYCVQDSKIVLDLFTQQKSWAVLTQMATVFNVCAFALYTSGQQGKIFAQVYREAFSKNIVVEKNGYVCAENESYTGAIVLEPISGMHTNVITVDFASLYPSCMSAKNISYETLVRDKWVNGVVVKDASIPDEDCFVFEWEDHYGCPHDTIKRGTKIAKKKILCAKRYYRFLKPVSGLVPTLLNNLVAERKKIKNEMEEIDAKIKEESDSLKKKELKDYYSLLDVRQNSVKASTNSIYGAMGVVSGKLPFMPGAMCTTCAGRSSLMTAKDTITKLSQNRGLEITVIYGDTDSIMYNYVNSSYFLKEDGTFDYEKFEKVAKEDAAEVSKKFNKPMKLEFEAIAKKFLMLTKKKYEQELINGKRKKRGIMTTRRDNSGIARKIYDNMIEAIFDDYTYDQLCAYLVECLNDLYNHCYPTKEYAITKSIKDIPEYKVKELPTDPIKRAKALKNKFLPPNSTDAQYFARSLPPHVQLAEKMRRRGENVEAGERIDYVIIRTDNNAKAKIWQKIESAPYYKSHSDIIRLDMDYYIKSLVNPGDQVMEAMYKKTNFFKNQYEIRCIKNNMLDELRSKFRRDVIIIK